MSKESGGGRAPEIGQRAIGGQWPPVFQPPPPPVSTLETPEEVIRKATQTKQEEKVIDPRVLEWETLPDEDIVRYYNDAGLPNVEYDRTEFINRLVEAGIRVLD